ncbi:hypothetical protein [Macrococcus capreoli]|uniref:hypothetical protein n=1 Tax=Macrococcus capreoli TaxID=2982690 RepID=UPI003F438A47
MSDSIKDIVNSKHLSEQFVHNQVKHNIEILKQFLKNQDINYLRDELQKSQNEMLTEYHLNKSLNK